MGSYGEAFSYERGTPVAAATCAAHLPVLFYLALQGYLAHQKTHPSRTLQQAYA